MTVINTNVKALYTQAAMQKSAREMTAAMQQLSTGKRINSGKDDAAGLAIAARMTQQIRSLNMAVRNAGDAITLLQTAEGATGEMTDMIQRMRELAIQAINDTNNGEQRGYLDLEFQQLKQEIVRIAETTEWNGFSVLDGSAGYAVGDRPVYKTTSVSSYDSIFVNPITSIAYDTQSGSPGEVQVITFNDVDTTGGTYSLTVGDGEEWEETVSVSVAASDAAEDVAAAFAAQLETVGNIASVTRVGGALLVAFKQGLGDVPAIHGDDTVALTAPAWTTANPTFDQEFEALADPVEAGAAYLQSGTLTVNFVGETVAATFENNAGVSFSVGGNYDATTGVLTFPAEYDGKSNSAIFSGAVTYTIEQADSDGGVPDLDGASDLATTREFGFAVRVQGSLPELMPGDLYINEVSIRDTRTGDDTLSPANNALGSAIAKAAAINASMAEHAADNGYTQKVYAVVNENVMAGGAQSGTSVVTGRVVINGVTSPEITSVQSNPSRTREAVVNAINLIADMTGVRAYNTGTADEGVRLVAADGRNIEVAFDTGYPVADFAARMGLRSGVQGGTYSLETSVEGDLITRTDEDGLISNSGLRVGNFTQNVSTVSSDSRTEVAIGEDPVVLRTGDLIINGVAIRGSRAIDDDLTQSAATNNDTNSKAASAIAIAAAINASTEATGVTAVANPATVAGDTTEVNTSRRSGTYSIYLNGAEVEVDFTAEAGDTATRLAEVKSAIEGTWGKHGVTATINSMGGLTLETDGRNLSVWIPSGVTAAEFGLTYDGEEPAGVTLYHADDSPTADTASTVYGGVTLKSSGPITVEPGASGYSSASNFRALGFQEGTFGGVVDESETKMTPPRTGRLTFHVGPSAGQTVTIDLADFGKGGPITSEITGDVDLDDPVNRIDTVAKAQEMLAKLDSSIDKVNATRARMGAVMNRLEHVIDNLMNVSMNTEASRSQIEDADYAAASTQLARTQIMQQASTAVLAQANASQQSVLKLLQ
jgi:flagellin